MQAGRMRHRIKLLWPTNGAPAAQNSFGEPQEPSGVFAAVWAAIEPVYGREKFQDGREYAAVTHRVTIRYLPTIRPDLIIEQAPDGPEGRRIRYDIEAIQPDAVQETMTLLAREVTEWATK